jgi:hypothetical protein
VKGAAGGVGSNQNIIENFASNVGGYRLLALGDGRLFWELTTQAYEINGALDGNWQFLTLGWDGSNMVASINGVVTTFARTTTVQGPAREFRLGRSSDFDIGPTAAWDRALTSAEITALYNSGAPRYYHDLTTAEKVDIVSFWNLDEEGGSRADSHGSNTFTDNNTVGTALGEVAAVSEDAISLKTDLVASFDSANSESLSIEDAAQTGLDFGSGEFTISLWVYPVSISGTQWILAKGAENTATVGFTAFRAGSIIYCRLVDANLLGVQISMGGIAAGVWHNISMRRDAAGSFQAFLNGVFVGAALQGASVDRSVRFALAASSGLGSSCDAWIANAAAWHRALLDSEITELYNSGSPLSYQKLNAGLKTDLVSFWNLNEPRGTRYDSHSQNHLTDNNTVAAAHGAVEYEATQYAGITKWSNQGTDASPFADVVTPTALKAPQFISGIPTWDGANTASLYTATGTVTPDSAIYVVARADSDGPSGAGLVDSDDPILRHLVYLVSDNLRAYSSSGDHAATTNDGHDRFGLYAEYTPSSITAKVGGETFQNTSATPDGMVGLSIGGYHNQSLTGSWDGTIEAVLVFDRVLTNVEKAALTSYFS